MQVRKRALLAVLLGIMVAITGCFGGRYATGGVEGFVYALKEDLQDGAKGDLIVSGTKDLIYNDDYAPLEGAIVSAEGTRNTAETNSSGRFVLTGIPVGRRTITINHPLYKPRSIEMDIIADTIRLIPRDRTTLAGKGYYLLIGVGNFDPQLDMRDYGINLPGFSPYPTPLLAPSEDVGIMERAILYDNQLKTGSVISLVDKWASKENVERKLRSLISQMTEDDYLVVYFSGHGIGGDNQMQYDAVVLYNDLLADYELKDMIEDALRTTGLWLEDITIIIDACHSGSFADGIPSAPIIRTKAFRKYPYTVITSSRPNEESWELQFPDGTWNSLFTHHVERALVRGNADYNRDGAITASELYRYVQPRVYSDAERLKGNRYGVPQNVYLWQGKGDPVLFRYYDI